LLACHPGSGGGGRGWQARSGTRPARIGFVKLAASAKERVVAEILENVAKRLAPYKAPEGPRVIDALPRNALSKVDRRALERMIGEDESPWLSVSSSASAHGQRTARTTRRAEEIASRQRPVTRRPGGEP
jgi:long-chain acyl-CoA synthetase